MSYHWYHTGIKRDTKNKTIFRRNSDSQEVELEGWHSSPVVNYPNTEEGRDFLIWFFFLIIQAKTPFLTALIEFFILFVNTVTCHLGKHFEHNTKTRTYQIVVFNYLH